MSRLDLDFGAVGGSAGGLWGWCCESGGEEAEESEGLRVGVGIDNEW